VNNIVIHQLNLGPFRSLKSLVENPFKKCVSLHFLSNKCIMNFYFWEKTITLKKGGDFIGGNCMTFKFSFGLVICYELQTWSRMAIEKMYVTYFMHNYFI
jgi:hypothetical protein